MRFKKGILPDGTTHKITIAEWPDKLRWKLIRSDGLRYYECTFGPFVMYAEPMFKKPPSQWRAYVSLEGGDALEEERNGYGGHEAAQEGALLILKRWLSAGVDDLARLRRR